MMDINIIIAEIVRNTASSLIDKTIKDEKR